MKETKIIVKPSIFRVTTDNQFFKQRLTDMAKNHSGVIIIASEPTMIVEISRNEHALGFATPDDEFIPVD